MTKKYICLSPHSNTLQRPRLVTTNQLWPFHRVSCVVGLFFILTALSTPALAVDCCGGPSFLGPQCIDTNQLPNLDLDLCDGEFPTATFQPNHFCDVSGFCLLVGGPGPGGPVTCNGLPTTTGCTVNGVVGDCVGNPGDDTIVGTSGPDVISGQSGIDRIFGKEGDDLICGDDGNDLILGQGGGDTILGGNNNDFIIGGILSFLGSPFISDGDDIMFGEAGDDLIVGGPGDDNHDGGGDIDRCIVSLGGGNDTTTDCEQIF